ncbi:MAG TPA: response regulator [Thermoanaerobaculaceae bacterium]|nr:response regulator [Thermoanaerobaculaceae bacterium]
MRALILDDSRAMRTILKGILAEVGFEVQEAATVRDALSVLGKDAGFDLALVDWNLPDVEGIEFVRQVRSQRKYDRVKLMMVTTETETAQVASAIRAGANEYIMKPFSKQAVAEKLVLMGFEVGQGEGRA